MIVWLFAPPVKSECKNRATTWLTLHFQHSFNFQYFLRFSGIFPVVKGQRWASDWTWIGLGLDNDEFCWIWIGSGLQIAP